MLTKATLFFFGCFEVNSTWLITSELANQSAQKVLFTCVVYTELNHNNINVAKCNLVKRKTMLVSSISQGFDAGWLGVLCRGPTWLTAQLRMSSYLSFVNPVG